MKCYSRKLNMYHYICSYCTTIYYTFKDSRALCIQKFGYIHFFFALSNYNFLNNYSKPKMLLKKVKYHYSRSYCTSIRSLGCVTIVQTSRQQGILKATVSGVFEDLKFKISEGSEQNFKFKVLKYYRNCSLQYTWP